MSTFVTLTLVEVFIAGIVICLMPNRNGMKLLIVDVIKWVSATSLMLGIVTLLIAKFPDYTDALTNKELEGLFWGVGNLVVVAIAWCASLALSTRSKHR